MTQLNASYKALEILYEKDLILIKNIKFTFREIDMIACILHNRSEKKIASICSISPRTVSAHVYNIMGKLRCNSKQDIIDFIELSGTLSVFREYYLQLLIRYNFEKFLSNLNSKIGRCNFTWYILPNEHLLIPENLYQLIQKHIRACGVKLIEVNRQDLLESNSQLIMDNSKECIIDASIITGVNYYEDIFNLIRLNLMNFIPDTIATGDLRHKLEEVFNEFRSKVNTIDNISTDNLRLQNTVMDSNKNIRQFLIRIADFVGNKSLSLKILMNIALLATTFGIYKAYNHVKNIYEIHFAKDKKSLTNSELHEMVKHLESFLDSIKNEQFSANNSDQDQALRNQSSITKIEKILDYQNHKAIENYCINAQIKDDIIVSYLHSLHAIASYYMYHSHNGRKSREILMHGKKLAENCAHYKSVLNTDITSLPADQVITELQGIADRPKRSDVKVDFATLSADEAITELKVIKGLPQIYTRLIYSLGRTHIYLNEYENGKKYFELSRALGQKLDLFESYLSDISGLLIIEKHNAELNIHKGKIGVARKKLDDLVKTYRTLLEDKKSYILDYNSSIKEQKFIIPNKQIYNIVACINNTIDIYVYLLEIVNKDELNVYITDLCKLLSYQNNKQSLLNITSMVSSRKTAHLYNMLGRALVILYDRGVKSDQMINMIRKELPSIISDSEALNGLKLAEKLYEKSKSISRNADYTKADAYDGMIRLNELKIRQLHLSQGVGFKETIDILTKESEELASKRDYINQSLNRKAND